MANRNLKDAFNLGAQYRRAGQTLQRTMEAFTTDAEKSHAMMGFRSQEERPRERVLYDSHFLLTDARRKVAIPTAQRRHEMRTAEDLQKLKDEYRPAYDEYAENERKAGREPTSFDDAFNSHLEALDAEAASPGSTATAGDPGAKASGKKASTGGKKGAKASTKGTATGAKASSGTKAPPKEKAAPKPKGFRPTSDDRKTVNAAAQKVLGKDGNGRNHRLLIRDGKSLSPYVDFLQGRAMKLDAQGNSTADLVLNVYSAADLKTVRGTVTLSVKKNALSAKSAKA